MLYSLPVLTLLFAIILNSASAATTTLCENTALGKSLANLEAQSLELSQPAMQDWIQPILDEAKTFSKSHPTKSTYLTFDDLDQLTKDFQTKLNSDLESLEKNHCISHVTSLTLETISYHTEFTSNEDIEIDQSVQRTPNPAIYLFNQNEYRKMAESKLDAEKMKQWHLAKTQLDRSLPSKKNYLGRLTPTEHLLLTYSRTEINLLSNLFMETLTLMTADTMKATAFSSVTNREVELTFTPTDLAHLSIRYMNRAISQLNQMRSFAGKNVETADVLLAAFYNQEVDAESVLVLIKNKSIIAPRDTFLKHLGKLTWSAAKVVLYQIPVTLPFITVGTILYDAIQSKKTLERSKADAAHLIPSQ